MNSSALIVTYTLLMVPSIPDKTKTKPISPQPLGPESRNAPRPQRRGALRDSSTDGCEGETTSELNQSLALITNFHTVNRPIFL